MTRHPKLALQRRSAMLTSSQLSFGSGLCSVQPRAVCVHMETGSRTRDVQHLVVLDFRLAAPALGRELLNLVREVLDASLRVGKGLGLFLVVDTRCVLVVLDPRVAAPAHGRDLLNLVRAVLDAGPRVVHTRCGEPHHQPTAEQYSTHEDSSQRCQGHRPEHHLKTHLECKI
jgi:hypothetical protein